MEDGSDPNDQASSSASPMSTTTTTTTTTTTESSQGVGRTSSGMSGWSETVTGSDSCSEGTGSPVRWVPHQASAEMPLRSMTHPVSRLGMKKYMRCFDDEDDDHDDRLGPVDIELEMMKERFSKLLLGEDMSGGGKGVCTALAISNAITNLYATVFGNHQRLEPIKTEQKVMWRREMDCLLSVCDYILEVFIPDTQDEDGAELDQVVMSARQRSDIQMNLPALKKLDTMLIDILDSFQDPEYWYVSQQSVSSSMLSRATSFRKLAPRNDDKWWLPVPCVPSGGLSDQSRKQLRHQRDCANQIHKAALEINNTILNEMEVPESYMSNLPKSGKSCLGDSIYKYMYSADGFQPDELLDALKISSEHAALELADRVEACMYTWRRKAGMTHTESSWNMKKDFRYEADRSDKNHLMAERAEILLFFLKHRYPELSQTTLDSCKIQYNRDVGQAILESYSRVLEGLAFNVVAWIDDLLAADKLMDRSKQGHV